MYKPGDIVYCIDNIHNMKGKQGVLNNLCLDTPYVVEKSYINSIILEKCGGNIYNNSRFISEKKYIINKRLEKINKICLKLVK